MRHVLHGYATAEDLFAHMERGVADLAVGPRPEKWPGPVSVVGAEEMVMVLPPGDPLAGRAAVRIDEVADQPWVRCALEPVLAGRRWLDVECERAGCTPRTTVRVQHTSTAYGWPRRAWAS